MWEFQREYVLQILRKHLWCRLFFDTGFFVWGLWTSSKRLSWTNSAKIWQRTVDKKTCKWKFTTQTRSMLDERVFGMKWKARKRACEHSMNLPRNKHFLVANQKGKDSTRTYQNRDSFIFGTMCDQTTCYALWKRDVRFFCSIQFFDFNVTPSRPKVENVVERNKLTMNVKMRWCFGVVWCRVDVLWHKSLNMLSGAFAGGIFLGRRFESMPREHEVPQSKAIIFGFGSGPLYKSVWWLRDIAGSQMWRATGNGLMSTAQFCYQSFTPTGGPNMSVAWVIRGRNNIVHERADPAIRAILYKTVSLLMR